METAQVWTVNVKRKDGLTQCVWDLCYSPDGSQLIVAAGTLVIVYRGEDASLIKNLKGHKESVYCVAYSHDAKYFASGSADKCVIIWKASTLDGLLKYMHNDAIQCLEFNPSTVLLASCACSDFGFWTLEQKSVIKTKLTARATCCSWKSDGQFLAIGQYNGVISIRNKATEEIVKVERSAIIWHLKWNGSKNDQSELLAVADWSQKLSLYQLCGKQIIYGDGQKIQQLTLVLKTGKDRSLGYDPCHVDWFGTKNESIVVCGSNKSCQLYSCEGNKLATINELSSWIWCCSTRPGKNQITVGCEDGTIENVQLVLTTVHSLYRDRYAFRESLTDVVVQHLVTEQRARIKCRDYVKKVAVFKNRLAIQLSDKILIYEPLTDDPNDMHYRVRDKLVQTIECQLLVVTTHNFVVCQESHLTCLNFQGIKEREWILDSSVRYIRIAGGPPTKETLLVGLKNGQVVKIILDNTFPIPLIKVMTGIRCVDISRNRDKLGVIDDNNTLTVFCLHTKEMLFQEPDVLSLAWSITNNDLLAYSGSNLLFIKAANFPSHCQYAKGVAVSFTGSTVYCLQDNSMNRVEISMSPAIYHYLGVGQLDEAYQLACYGLTDPDWKIMGEIALTKLKLKVAKYAYMHLGNILMLTFIQELEERHKRGEWNENIPQNMGTLIVQGDISAYLGKFNKAALFYSKAGSELNGQQYIIEMYTDLRRFSEAREAMNLNENLDKCKQLLSKHADWAKSTNEHRTATKMYIDAGEYAKAIDLCDEHGWTDILLDISRRLDKGDQDCLERCARSLTRLGEYAFAADCYAKYGNIESQLNLYVEALNWEEAFALAEKYPEQMEKVYLPYAQWLAENDKFEEAQAAFIKAGLQNQAINVLEQLAKYAATESRFDDAGFYHWKLSILCLDMLKNETNQKNKRALLDKFYDFQKKADVYYVYHNIHRYLHEPFVSHMPETYFNMARYLAHVLQAGDVNDVSKVAVLYTLAKHGRALGAYKLTRQIYERLQNFYLPTNLQNIIELSSLVVRSGPNMDSEEILTICYRCSTTNPLLSSTGNRCINCKEPFVYSFITLDQLPLVEFVPEDGLTHEEVMNYLKTEPPQKYTRPETGDDRQQTDNANSQTLKINPNLNNGSDLEQDAFTAKLLNSDLASGTYSPVQLDISTLKAIPISEVIVIDHPPLKPRYYKSVLPEVSITQCLMCHKLFSADDYELVTLQKGHCPYCRTPKE